MQADFTGLGVVTLDALTRREWMNEDELASEIKAHPKVLRRVLRYLEQVRDAGSDACIGALCRNAVHGYTASGRWGQTT